jgi:putative membrane protein
MIKTFRLAGYELRRFKGPLPILGLLFLLLIPTLVGALYLWSNWDPYGKTDQVPVAVVNEDVSVEVEGQTIDAGDRLVAELRSNPIFDWQFVDRDQAEAGLSDGSYYMIVSIPADFSENLISGAGANPDRAVVDIVLNDSNNYLMELLAASAQNELEAAIDRAAVGAYFESVFANLDTIRTEVLAASSNASQLAATSNVALSGMTELSTAVSTSKQSSSQLVSGLADSKASSTQLVTGLAGAKSESTALSSGLSTLESSASQLSSGADGVTSGSQSIGSSIAPALSAVDSADASLGPVSDNLGVLSDNLDVIAGDLTTDPPTDLPAAIARMNAAAAQITTAATQVGQQATAVDNASGSLSSASSDLSSANSEVTALAASSAQVATSAETVSAGVSTASSGASSLDSTLGDLSTQATDMDTGIGALQLTAQQLDDGLTTAETGSVTLLDQVTQIDSGANQLASDLAAGADRIPTLASDDLANTEQVLSSPADVQITVDYPANEYGRGMAPLFFGIAIWVFAIAVFLVMRPISGRALAGRASSWRISMAGWLPVVGIASLGALLLLGIVWGTLGLDPVNVGGAIGVVILAAACFTAIAQLLRTWLGAAGSAITLVLLMVQLTASGGLYPVETTPAPFRVIHDFLPMTYLVDALRVTFTGGTYAHLWRDVAVLAGFLIVALGLCILVVHRRRRFRMHDLHPVLA